MRFRRPTPASLAVVVANTVAAALLVTLVLVPGRESPEAAQPATAPESADERLDRYTAAVLRSRASFPSGPVRVAFLVTGEESGDAVTAGPPAAVLGGPVLTLPVSGVPPVVRRELSRLEPGRIVVLGGTAAVSDETAEQLQDLTTGPVTRLAGADRYATAALAATTVFTAPVPQVLVMTDTAHADPGGVPLEASATRPVLLTTAGGLPPETVEALRQLRPRGITVLGDVSEAVMTQLQRFTAGPVARLPRGASEGPG